MQISRFEFDDPDDPESACNNDAIRFRIAPEGMVIALPNGKFLTSEDQQVLGKMLRVAYEQGKQVGRILKRLPE